jgi:murein DD-endopeptidase MepM/ murein hydrolase activator NlpD
VTIGSASVDSQPSEVTLRPTIDRLVRLRRTAAGWVGAEELLPWSIDTAVVTGVIHSTLYEAFDAAAPTLPRAARSELVWTLADIFEYRVDMSRDLQDGDAFRVLYERATAPNGLVKVDKILAATFDLSGSRVEAIRYESRGGAGHYFDGEGKSLQAAFLRAPLEFRRISSVFGMRKHPILGVWKQHKGTDYAAAQGTPVRAIGDGVVIFAGQKHGYGNVLDIRHRNGFVSRYGHLHGFAAGVHTGTHVAIGRTVAYVGMTGLATAPHLHFEVLVGGVQHDPKIALRMKDGLPIPGGERDSFERTRTLLLASLDAGDSHNRLAMR